MIACAPPILGALVLESLNCQMFQTRRITLAGFRERDHLSCNQLCQWIARTETKRIHHILIGPPHDGDDIGLEDGLLLMEKSVDGHAASPLQADV
jgi:hypothetical protein